MILKLQSLFHYISSKITNFRKDLFLKSIPEVEDPQFYRK